MEKENGELMVRKTVPLECYPTRPEAKSARGGCWAMELANIPSAAQGVALICAPALDSDQVKDFFFSRDQHQISNILSTHVVRSSVSGEKKYVTV